MILRFKSKRNTNGHRRYLAIDTERRVYCTRCRSMIADGEEITTTALRNIEKTIISEGYRETDSF